MHWRSGKLHKKGTINEKSDALSNLLALDDFCTEIGRAHV